jgi:hypothetical protein
LNSIDECKVKKMVKKECAIKEISEEFVVENICIMEDWRNIMQNLRIHDCIYTGLPKVNFLRKPLQ